MKPEERDLVRVKHIHEAIINIQKFTRGLSESDFHNNELVQSAVIRQFEIIGEAATNISEVTKDKYPEVEWRIIKDFRNLLIHEYFRVDASEVWYSIQFDIPDLELKIHSILSD